jgi:hypothetical protein
MTMLSWNAQTSQLMHLIAPPPGYTVDFVAPYSTSLPPGSYTNMTTQCIETHPNMPQYGSGMTVTPGGGPGGAPPWEEWYGYPNYPVITNFSCQLRARFTVPAGLGGNWNFSYGSDDGADISVWNDAAFTSQVGATIGAYGNNGTGSGNGNVSLTAGNTYYLRVRWGQGGGAYFLWVMYTPPGGTARYLTDDAIINGVLYISPFRPVGGIAIMGTTRTGDRYDLLNASGTVVSSYRCINTGVHCSLALPSPPLNGSVRLTEMDGTVDGTLAATFNGGECIRVGVRI